MIPDNYSQFAYRERRQQRELDERPACSICENPIQDDKCYNINGELICASCMDEHFSVNTEDYMR